MVRLLSFGLLVSLLACAGSPRQSGLRHKITAADLAQVPEEKKEDLRTAKEALAQARMADNQAASNLRQGQSAARRANQTLTRTKTSLTTAKKLKKTADANADLSKRNAAAAQVHQFEARLRAARTKTSYAKAAVNYLKEQKKYTTKELRAKEAALELEQARLIRPLSRRPRGFVFANYQNQARKTRDQSKRAFARAQRVKRKIPPRRNAWMKAVSGVPHDDVGAIPGVLE